MNPKTTCTKDNPAPPVRLWDNGVNHSRNWNSTWHHPEITEECINEEHDDYKITCKNCGQSYISEGIDS